MMTETTDNNNSIERSSKPITLVIPGQKVCDYSDSKIELGPGTYESEGIMYSCLAGYLLTEEVNNGKIRVTICTRRSRHLVPVVGGLVTGRVTHATPRFCKLAIIGSEENIFEVPYKGLLRKEDVKATEKDKVEIHKSFRPGDIVLCRVIGLGDVQSYILSTAENELGVVLATSEAGESMVPVSWREMQCTTTLRKEFRKVAKPSEQFIAALKGITLENQLSESGKVSSSD